MDIATDITRRYMTLSLTALNSDVTFTLVGVNGTSQKGGGHMSELLAYFLEHCYLLVVERDWLWTCWLD